MTEVQYENSKIQRAKCIVFARGITYFRKLLFESNNLSVEEFRVNRLENLALNYHPRWKRT